MIDIENMIVDKVYNAVHAAYPNARVVSMYTENSTVFPLVSIYESDNYSHRATQDGEAKDHAVNVAYTVSVFTNDPLKKSTAKAIADVVDGVMIENLFTRTMRMQVPNLDRTIYRIELRYEAVVGEPKVINGETIYQMYRR